MAEAPGPERWLLRISDEEATPLAHSMSGSEETPLQDQALLVAPHLHQVGSLLIDRQALMLSHRTLKDRRTLEESTECLGA
jgi:hypothetical protein